MILTVTLNPSLDRTVELGAALRRGAVQRAAGARQDAGGKGVNISRALRASGTPTLAVLPADPGDPLLAELDAAGVPHESVPAGAPVRSNVTITEPDGTTTKLNAPGTPLTAQRLEELAALLVRHGAGASWIVLAGSLPPGAEPGTYAQLVRRVRAALGEHAPRIAVDTSGPALAGATADDDALPDLIKPNGEELAELVGRGDGEALEADPARAAAVAAALVGRGLGAVLTTLGAGGAVLTTAAGSWHAVHAPVAVRSTVGAGDSSLAGYLLAHERGDDPAGCLRQAVASGTAAAALPGTRVPALSGTTPEAVAVRELAPQDAAG
ncbi:1-phosphofructokinase family hexose kinase [Kocuria flava]|uniref:1-phosphofructokinase family hexose kinase n=1 Tax=Kocuria flava TaxID=446860 RepID=UPI001FF211A7|nr:1-phosphofructokinase family hexose kinase [Kocuria flava]MCJ8505203.1 1-phosphofructokinase family hexose kinase [Kocuria flava]